MANNNVQNVRFLRNGVLFGTHDLAYNALTNFTLTTEQDGTIILARYGSGNDVKTLAGLVYAKGDNKSITIIDIEGASADVEKLRQEINAKLGIGITSTNTATAQLTALSGTSSDGSGVTSVWGAKAYAKDYTVEQINGLNFTGVTADDNKVVYNVTEADGIVSAATKNISSVKLDGYAEGSDAKVAATDTLGEALGKLQGQINAMDLTVVSGDGEVITAVSEADGKVSANKTAIKDVKLTGYVKDATKTGNIAATDDIEDALSKLENKAAAITITNADGSINVTPASTSTDINVNIKTGEHVIAKDGDAGIYTDLKLNKITASLPAEIKERYQLIATDGSQIGSNIDIYKDSSVVSIQYQSDPEQAHYQNLIYTYIDVSGNTQTEYVDISALVLEAEFASGITVTDHVAHGVVDPASEKDESNVAFLTVGANGFKVSGIKDAIDTKINKLDADLSGNTTHVTVGVKEVDGKLTAVTVAENNIASQSLLDTLSGKTVTAVEMTGGTAAISAHTDGTKKITINTDGSQILMTGYAKGSDSGAVATGDSINVAIGKLENQIAGKVDALDATVSGQTTDGKVKVQVVQENGVLTAVTVTGTDIASDSALTAEIAARKAVDGQDGQTYAANASANYISNANSLNDADVKLDAALKIADDAMLTGVAAGNGITVSTKENKSQTISAKVNGDGGIVNDENGLHLGGIDCGTY